jgi:hypothetical protein
LFFLTVRLFPFSFFRFFLLFSFFLRLGNRAAFILFLLFPLFSH